MLQSCEYNDNTIQCTSDIVATFGHPFLATISDWPLLYIRTDYNRTKCILYQGKWPLYPNGTINVATISGVHCILNDKIHTK